MFPAGLSLVNDPRAYRTALGGIIAVPYNLPAVRLLGDQCLIQLPGGHQRRHLSKLNNNIQTLIVLTLVI